jgi:hypothetical protein
MNPWGILFVGLGIIIFIIGFKGSQHTVLQSFKNVKSPGATTAASPASATMQPGTVLA